ncbi:MAG: efflux RND transporter periplasmic adaptor subunit [Patescibacteria group bacterium]|jgi:macrolide-specific efflux system membrane fusion protein
MIKFLKKRWYLILIIILVAGFIFYKNSSAATAKNKVDSYTIKKEDLKEVLTLSGEIDAEEKVTLKFQTSGRLTWVGVKEGDYVKKYQTLASLDQRDIQNRLTKYLNTFAVSRNDFEQTIDDNWNLQYDLSESIRKEAERVLKNNQFSLENAVLDVEYQHLSLEYANLWTPIDGIVTHISSPFAGVNITPAGADFEVVNPKTLYFSVTAEQGDVINLKEGDVGDISFDAYPDQKFRATINYISFSPKTGETGTVYELRLKLDNQAEKLPLKLAMTGDVDFLIKQEKNVLSAPSSFIKKDSKGDYVYIGSPDKKVKKYVDISTEIDGKYIITNGLQEKDVIYD